MSITKKVSFSDLPHEFKVGMTIEELLPVPVPPNTQTCCSSDGLLYEVKKSFLPKIMPFANLFRLILVTGNLIIFPSLFLSHILINKVITKRMLQIIITSIDVF